MDHRFVSHGLPSESKLAMYMSHLNAPTSLEASPKITSKGAHNYSSPFSLNNTIGDISHKLDHHSTVTHIGTGNMYTTPIKGINSMQIDSSHSIIDSPRLTPQSSPTSTVSATSNIHQENVGGTTYFYPTINTNHTTVDQLVSNSLSGSVNGSNIIGNGSSSDTASQQQQQQHQQQHQNKSHSRSNTESPTFFDFNYQSNKDPQQQQQQHQKLQQQQMLYPGPSTNMSYIQQQKQQVQRSQHTALQALLSEELRNDVQKRKDISNYMPSPNDCLDIPQEIDNYHSLCLLENIPMQTKQPVTSSTYRATNINNGSKFCLRRLHGFRIQSGKCMTVIDMWRKLRHSNIVQLREVFTTKAFSDNSLILVYDYHAGSETLLSKYFYQQDTIPLTNGYSSSTSVFELRTAILLQHKGGVGGGHRQSNAIGANGSAVVGGASGNANTVSQNTITKLLPENELWSIIMQLTAGLRVIHQAGLACRTLDPTKIIVCGKRIRFSFPGISDILYFDPSQTNTSVVIQSYQQEDLTALGKLILALACRSLTAVHEDNIQNSVTIISRQYSKDLSSVILYLMMPTRRTVTDLMPMIGARFYTQLDSLQNQCDIIENELTKEMDNGRLYRILVKLGCINERPELNLDITWSETGDRYMLKLFRDYLFHSVTEDGQPWLDHGHIVQCLNKLDAGTIEKVQLMSRDGESILVVSYAELKHCLEQAFTELTTIV